jgi:hypothetical protein
MVEPSSSPAPKRPSSDSIFNDLKREVARRNDEAQKVARVKRTAREKEQIAVRRLWEQQL